MIRQTIAALMLLFLLSSPASAPPFDSSDPDGWLTDPSNFNDRDFVANFVASIDTVGSGKAADMLRNDALPDSRRKDILLALSAKPDTQASLIRALTRDAEKQATDRYSALLNDVLSSPAVPFAVKTEVFGTEGISLARLQSSFFKFATDKAPNGLGISRIAASGQAAPDREKSLKYLQFAASGTGWTLKNGKTEVDSSVAQGRALTITPDSIIVETEGDGKSAKNRAFIVSGESKVIARDGKLLLVGGKDEMDISKFLDGRKTGASPQLRFGGGFEAKGAQYVFSVQDLGKCAGSECATFFVTLGPSISSKQFSFSYLDGGPDAADKGKIIVSQLDDKGTVLRSYAVDQQNGGDTEIVVTNKGGKAQLHFQNRKGQTDIGKLGSDGNPFDGGLTRAILLEKSDKSSKSDYIVGYDPIEKRDVEILYNAIPYASSGQIKTADRPDAADRITNEINGKDKITVFYTRGDSTTLDAFKILQKKDIDSMEALLTDTFLYRERLNTVIVEQSLDPDKPQLMIGVRYTDGTKDPVDIKTYAEEGGRTTPLRRTALLNGIVAMESAYNQNLRMYQTSPKVHLLGDTGSEYVKSDNFYYTSNLQNADIGRTRAPNGQFMETMRVTGKDVHYTRERVDDGFGQFKGFRYALAGATAEQQAQLQDNGLLEERIIEGAGYIRASGEADQGLSTWNALGRRVMGKTDMKDAAHYAKAEISYDLQQVAPEGTKGIGTEAVISLAAKDGGTAVTKLYLRNDNEEIRLVQGELKASRSTSMGSRVAAYINAQIMGGTETLAFPPNEDAILEVNGIRVTKPATILSFSTEKGMQKINIEAKGEMRQDLRISPTMTIQGKEVVFNYEMVPGSRKVDLNVKATGELQVAGQQGEASTTPIEITFRSSDQSSSETREFLVAGVEDERVKGTAVLSRPKNPFENAQLRQLDVTILDARNRETKVTVANTYLTDAGIGKNLVGEDIRVVRTVEGQPDTELSAENLNAVVRMPNGNTLQLENINLDKMKALVQGLELASGKISAGSATVETGDVTALFIRGLHLDGQGTLTYNGNVIALATAADKVDLNALFTKEKMTAEASGDSATMQAEEQTTEVKGFKVKATFSRDTKEIRIGSENLRISGSTTSAATATIPETPPEIVMPDGKASLRYRDGIRTAGLAPSERQQIQKAVTELQAQMKGREYYRGEIDGKFGVLTRDAVKKFQAEYNNKGEDQLRVDGIFGPLTKAAFEKTAPKVEIAADAKDAAPEKGKYTLDLGNVDAVVLIDNEKVKTAFTGTDLVFVSKTLQGSFTLAGNRIQAQVGFEGPVSDLRTAAEQAVRDILASGSAGKLRQSLTDTSVSFDRLVTTLEGKRNGEGYEIFVKTATNELVATRGGKELVRISADESKPMAEVAGTLVNNVFNLDKISGEVKTEKFIFAGSLVKAGNEVVENPLTGEFEIYRTGGDKKKLATINARNLGIAVTGARKVEAAGTIGFDVASLKGTVDITGTFDLVGGTGNLNGKFETDNKRFAYDFDGRTSEDNAFALVGTLTGKKGDGTSLKLSLFEGRDGGFYVELPQQQGRLQEAQVTIRNSGIRYPLDLTKDNPMPRNDAATAIANAVLGGMRRNTEIILLGNEGKLEITRKPVLTLVATGPLPILPFIQVSQTITGKQNIIKFLREKELLPR